MNKTELIMAVAEKANISKKKMPIQQLMPSIPLLRLWRKMKRCSWLVLVLLRFVAQTKDRAVIPEPILLSLFLLLKFLPLRLAKPLRALSTNKKAFIRKALERKSRAFFVIFKQGGMNRFFIA